MYNWYTVYARIYLYELERDEGCAAGCWAENKKYRFFATMHFRDNIFRFGSLFCKVLSKMPMFFLPRERRFLVSILGVFYLLPTPRRGCRRGEGSAQTAASSSRISPNRLLVRGHYAERIQINSSSKKVQQRTFFSTQAPAAKEEEEEEEEED